jgi:hypothetical protein
MPVHVILRVHGCHGDVYVTVCRAGGEPGSEEDMDYIKQTEELAQFEKGRLHLQQERVEVQKRVFTRWCNSFLEKVRL